MTKTKRPRQALCPGWIGTHNWVGVWEPEHYFAWCSECGASCEYDAGLGEGREQLRAMSYRSVMEDGCSE